MNTHTPCTPCMYMSHAHTTHTCIHTQPILHIIHTNTTHVHVPCTYHTHVITFTLHTHMPYTHHTRQQHTHIWTHHTCDTNTIHTHHTHPHAKHAHHTCMRTHVAFQAYHMLSSGADTSCCLEVTWSPPHLNASSWFLLQYRPSRCFLCPHSSPHTSHTPAPCTLTAFRAGCSLACKLSRRGIVSSCPMFPARNRAEHLWSESYIELPNSLEWSIRTHSSFWVCEIRKMMPVVFKLHSLIFSKGFYPWGNTKDCIFCIFKVHSFISTLLAALKSSHLKCMFLYPYETF